MVDNERVIRVEAIKVDLETYFNFLSKVIKAINSMDKMTQQKRLRLMNAILVKLDSIKTPHGYSKYIKELVNEVKGLQQGIEKNLSIDKLRPTQFVKIRLIVKDNLNELETRLSRLKAGEQEFENEEDKRTVKILERTNNEVTKIEKAKTKKWVAIRVSVIPICSSSMINITKLQNTFDASNMNGYAVLHQQLCIGINKQKLPKGCTCEEYLDQIITRLNDARGTELINLKEKPVISSITGINVNWYWLMTKHEANNFRLAFSNFNSKNKGKTYNISTISIRDWGFANAS